MFEPGNAMVPGSALEADARNGISTAQSLREVIQAAWPGLEAMADFEVERRSAPGRWSRKEALGHLIDLASTAHQAFQRAWGRPDQMDLSFQGDAWVVHQNYQQMLWLDLLMLWMFSNVHLARVMEATPECERLRPRHPHVLAHSVWSSVSENDSATLEDLMRDYVCHVNHHVERILLG